MIEDVYILSSLVYKWNNTPAQLEFIPQYRAFETKDISYAGKKRHTGKIVVPDGLSKEVLAQNVTHAATVLMRQMSSDEITIWAYGASDEQLEGGYSAAMCELTRGRTPEIQFNDWYFNPPKVDGVSRLSESQRRQIFKDFWIAEREADKAAMISMVSKYLKVSMPQNSNIDDVDAAMEKVYQQNKNVNILQEKQRLFYKLKADNEQRLMKKHKITKDERGKIIDEGSSKRWAME